VGAAFVDTNRDFAGLFKLHQEASIYIAELTAILKALGYTDLLRLPHIHILTDSKSATLSLKCPSDKRKDPKEIHQITKTIEKLRERGITVRISWIPSHKGIAPNERADQMANLARQIGRNMIQPLPPSAFFSKKLTPWRGQNGKQHGKLRED